MEIKIDKRITDTDIYVQLAGEIDAYTAPKVKEELYPLTEDKAVHITIDLSGVGYMDSTGLGVFVGLFKNVRANEGDLQIVGLSERLERLFDITGLADIIHITSETKGGI